MAYATISDARAAAPALDATDDEITTALAMAEALIDGRARRSFEALSLPSVTVPAVRTEKIVLDVPFTAVTGMTLHALGWSGFYGVPSTGRRPSTCHRRPTRWRTGS